MPKADAAKPKGANLKLRQFTFAPRKQYPLRLPLDVYERLSEVCAAASMTSTLYVSTVLELWLSAERDPTDLQMYEEDIESGRVTVTLRLLPSLFTRTQARAKAVGVSMNRLLTFVLFESLQQNSKRSK